ncbi:MAG: VWA domain-containing protein [Acidimicrobiales bacterium]|nr:VWA domain-containing protein [Acidimicrobiales bacterium]
MDLAAVGAAFAQRLHDAGVAATPERTGRFVRALVAARPATVAELVALARVTLVAGRADLDAFERVASEVFGGAPGGRSAPAAMTVPVPTPPLALPDDGDEEGDADEPGSDTEARAAASVVERLRTTDFGEWTEDERADLRRLVAELRVVAPMRPGRRHRRADHGSTLDLRATLRKAHRTAGDPVHRVHRRTKERRRRIVLLADVSGSMEDYARAYLHLLHGAVRATRAEAFVFATRLTRLTRVLRDIDPDEALAHVATLAPDWAGGTRIGEALRRFNDDHGRRGLARGAVVVVVSDGWERADPALLGEQMARLARLAHRVVWVNPRAATEGFAPLAGGMAAALPHVDVLLSGHSPAAMAELLRTIARSEDGRDRRVSPA